MLKIFYVGPFTFPSSNANSLRVQGMSEALAMAGHEVHILPGMQSENSSLSRAHHERIFVHPVEEYEGGLFSGLHRGLRGLFLGDVTLQCLQSLQFKPDVVVLYGTHLGYLTRLLSFCKKLDIPLLLDVVEWYDPRHLPCGFFGPFAIANELSMRIMAKKADGIFAISEYLQDHFSTQGCRTLRVPPIFSFHKERPQQFREANGKLNLCYVGSPGKKEDMKSIFQGLQLAYDAGVSYLMHVVGITYTEFVDSFGMETLPIFKASGIVKFYGRLENNETMGIVASCDFLVLLRKNRRFSKAGFPSKVAESLCLGTPIMANLSSSLGEHLIDQQNSIILQKPDALAFCEALQRAAQLSEEELVVIKTLAVELGDRDFRPYPRVVAISKFVRGIISR